MAAGSGCSRRRDEDTMFTCSGRTKLDAAGTDLHLHYITLLTVQNDLSKQTARSTVANDRKLQNNAQVRLSVYYLYFLQCFDTVGWAAGRASGL